MNSSKEISHKGRIVEVTPQFTTVEIVSMSACSACHAKGWCGLGDSKTKAIQLPTCAWDNYHPGDEVEVVLQSSLGHKAVWLAYIVPLIVLMSVLLVLTQTGIGELYAGLAAISAVALYYLIIWLFRGRLRDEYVFKIKS